MVVSCQLLVLTINSCLNIYNGVELMVKVKRFPAAVRKFTSVSKVVDHFTNF